MPATGSARRKFDRNRTTLKIPTGGTLTIGLTDDGEIKLSIDRTGYMIESFWASGPTGTRNGSAVILAPVE